MKQGWEIKKLGELVTIKTGKLDSNAMVDGGKYPFFTCSREIFAINDYAFDCEAILLAGNNASGDFNVKHYKGKFNAYQRTYVITVNESNRILYSYLYQQLTNHLKKFKEQSLGANTKFLKIGMIQGMEIHLPPLPEQLRIVSILDKAFAAIATAKANAEQNLKNAKELFNSYLQGVFEKKGDGWEEHNIEDCFKLKSGDGLTSKNMIEDGRYSVFGGNGIAGLHNRFNLSGSNVIIGRVGALCGNVRHITENIWLTDNAFNVTGFKFEFDHSFLTYLLNLKNLRSFARQAAQPVISNSSLKDVVLEFPNSVKAQQIIVAKLDALSTETKKLEAIYRQKIVDLEELKKSMLQKAFNGELKTTNDISI
ncbi:MAG: restriction endonuclease subunit S [Bacteroidales bacterium]